MSSRRSSRESRPTTKYSEYYVQGPPKVESGKAANKSPANAKKSPKRPGSKVNEFEGFTEEQCRPVCPLDDLVDMFVKREPSPARSFEGFTSDDSSPKTKPPEVIIKKESKLTKRVPAVRVKSAARKGPTFTVPSSVSLRQISSIKSIAKVPPLQKSGSGKERATSVSKSSSTAAATGKRPAETEISPRRSKLAKMAVDGVPGTSATTNNAGSGIQGVKAELETDVLKTSLKGFLEMGKKVALAITEATKNNEEILIQSSSSFEKKCYSMFSALALKRPEISTEEMESMIVLLDEEQEERRRYRRCLLNSLRSAHQLNMALYQQMLQFLKSL